MWNLVCALDLSSAGRSSMVGFHYASWYDYFEKDLRKTKNIEQIIINAYSDEKQKKTSTFYGILKIIGSSLSDIFNQFDRHSKFTCNVVRHFFV